MVQSNIVLCEYGALDTNGLFLQQVTANRAQLRLSGAEKTLSNVSTW